MANCSWSVLPGSHNVGMRSEVRGLRLNRAVMDLSDDVFACNGLCCHQRVQSQGIGGMCGIGH